MKPLFYSDYLEGGHPEILRRLQDTNMCQTPGYGVDDFCEKARATIKKLCDGLEITIKEFFQSDIFDDLEQEIK